MDDLGDDNYLNIMHDHGYNESDTMNCILYYATEVVVSRIYKKPHVNSVVKVFVIVQLILTMKIYY